MKQEDIIEKNGRFYIEDNGYRREVKYDSDDDEYYPVPPISGRTSYSGESSNSSALSHSEPEEDSKPSKSGVGIGGLIVTGLVLITLSALSNSKD